MTLFFLLSNASSYPSLVRFDIVNREVFVVPNLVIMTQRVVNRAVEQRKAADTQWEVVRSEKVIPILTLRSVTLTIRQSLSCVDQTEVIATLGDDFLALGLMGSAIIGAIFRFIAPASL